MTVHPKSEKKPTRRTSVSDLLRGCNFAPPGPNDERARVLAYLVSRVDASQLSGEVWLAVLFYLTGAQSLQQSQMVTLLRRIVQNQSGAVEIENSISKLPIQTPRFYKKAESWYSRSVGAVNQEVDELFLRISPSSRAAALSSTAISKTWSSFYEVMLFASAPSKGQGESNTAEKQNKTTATSTAGSEPEVGNTPPQEQPILPPAVAFSRAKAIIEPFKLEQCVTWPGLSGGANQVEDISRTLRAHALSSAQHFEELICMGTLQNVMTHRYQLETVRRVLRVLHGRALLADEVGLGKTIEAMIAMREYQLRGMVHRTLIVVPGPLVPQWLTELENKAGVSARSTDSHSFHDSPESFLNEAGVLVASLSVARGQKYAPMFRNVTWDLIIVDEAHHIKNRSTLGWKLIDGMKSRFLLLLTATPVENDLEEIYNLVTLLKPGQLATPASFRKEYINPKNPTSPKNRDKLRALLRDVMVRNTRAHSGLRLPPRFVTTVTVEPLAREKELYDHTVEALRQHASSATERQAFSLVLLEAGSSPSAAHATLRRMEKSERYSHQTKKHISHLASIAEAINGTKKLEAMLSILHSDPRQVLIFTRFRETLSLVENSLRSNNVPIVTFHGGLDTNQKKAALDAFRAGTRVLLATDLGGEGQNLQYCSQLINFDLPWNPMILEQRIGRLHRMGQTDVVKVYNLCTKGSGEERVLDVLDRRLNMFEMVVGEMDMVLGNLSDERDFEERVLSLYAQSTTDAELNEGMDGLAKELAEAKTLYTKSRALDAALFQQEFEA